MIKSCFTHYFDYFTISLEYQFLTEQKVAKAIYAYKEDFKFLLLMNVNSPHSETLPLFQILILRILQYFYCILKINIKIKYYPYESSIPFSCLKPLNNHLYFILLEQFLQSIYLRKKGNVDVCQVSFID